MVNFKFNFSFDDSKLKKLQQKIEELSRQKEIPLQELMPDNFIRKYTKSQTLQTMLDASGIENAEEIGNQKFSKFISKHTQFSTWEAMKKEALIEYAKRKLGF
jgi:SPX domain protein involved in polyphosphate accumulation